MVIEGLPGILARELQMNLDFRAELTSNLASGYRRLPHSLMRYLSRKYGIDMAALESVHDELLSHLVPPPAPATPTRPEPGRRFVVKVRRPATKTQNPTT